MLHKQTLVILVGVIALGGCGRGNVEQANANTTCTATLTGSQTATLDCAAWVLRLAEGNTYTIGLASEKGLAIALVLPNEGELSPGAYSISHANIWGGASYNPGGSLSTLWGTTKSAPGESVKREPLGTVTYTLTSVTATPDGESPVGKMFTIHGTLDATLPALPPTTGAVNVHAVF
ncbi:MAG: hypothetical protein LBV44_09130 [Methylobacillus sp.]|jgi:hypothetical protein|nr:hypothetical protein [Methylobacillus sp.]